jgi:probable rRNA maturation factor
MPRRSPRVEVTTRGGPFAVSAATVRRRAEKMLARLALDGVELSVALVDDATIRELNGAWRGYDRPTDVLAFALREGRELARLETEALGDVVISVPTAARQAKKQRRPLLGEVTMLLAHGLLHLLGYDHVTRAEEREMKAKTSELEAAAGRRERRVRAPRR